MNAVEILQFLKDNAEQISNLDIIVYPDYWTGYIYNAYGRIYFVCHGEYPCCHFDINETEFLKEYKNDNFIIEYAKPRT